MIKKHTANFLKQIFSGKTILITGAILITLTSLMIWASNKGLDITDESFYFIGYYFNIETVLPITFFHKIHNVFFGNENLILIRLTRLILTLTSAGFLGYTSCTFFNFKNKVEGTIFIIIFSFLGFSFYPYAISYNSLTIVFMNLLIGLTFIYKEKQILFIPFLIGILITLQLLTKFPTLFAISLFILLNYWLTSTRTKNVKNVRLGVLTLLSFLAGIIATCFIVFDSAKDFNQSYENFIKGLFLVKVHSISSTFTSIYYGFIHILSFSKIYILASILIVLLVNRTKWKYKTLLIIYSLLFTYALILFRITIITEPIGLFIPYFLILTIISFLFILFKKPFKKRDIIYALFFITLPFLISLGTNNSLFVHFIFGGNILGLGIYLLIEKLPKAFKTGAIWLLSITVLFQTSHNIIYKSYRLNTSIFEQTYTIKDIPALNNIKVDSALYEFTQKLSFLQKHPSKRLFLFSNQLGISLITDKPPFPFYWLEEKTLSSLKQILNNSERINPKSLLLVFPTKIKIDKNIRESFSSVNINFPIDYEIIKTVIYKDDTLNIYSHLMTVNQVDDSLILHNRSSY